MKLTFLLIELLFLCATLSSAFQLESDTENCQTLSPRKIESLQCGEQFLQSTFDKNLDMNASIVRKGEFPW